ncbi:DNA-processing protein DprA [Cognatilysobacter tabacisoli]|uniref:DNA-processing protein DprA n=1 Tax=Cognatilysobacter tabacisoli TaxID=2315424 RepID=UPI001E4BF977|nr:DNA-processing protein DprA [Lysobacter tabacisoli]
MSETRALLRWLAVGGAVAPRRTVLDRWGSAAAALDAGPTAWRAAGLDARQIEALGGPTTPAERHAHAWLGQPGHALLPSWDADYPPSLRGAPQPPLALFVAGDPTLLWRPAVAVVGTRTPTPVGRENARDFATAFSRAGLVVASGLAAGIDTVAHHAALALDAPTVAVLGTGPDVAYPRGNAALLARIAADGAVVSEHLPGTTARREHFPSRNRILAALALGTVVIEAAHRSGALITARLAAESGREVFALPGSIHNPMARGCHRLIRDGASLAESTADVLDVLGPLAAVQAAGLRRELGAPNSADIAETFSAAGEVALGTTRSPESDSTAPPSRSGDYNRLWQALGFDPTAMDQLVERTGLTPANLSSMLLAMELDGRVAVKHGRYFRIG